MLNKKGDDMDKRFLVVMSRCGEALELKIELTHDEWALAVNGNGDCFDRATDMIAERLDIVIRGNYNLMGLIDGEKHIVLH